MLRRVSILATAAVLSVVFLSLLAAGCGGGGGSAGGTSSGVAGTGRLHLKINLPGREAEPIQAQQSPSPSPSPTTNTRILVVQLFTLPFQSNAEPAIERQFVLDEFTTQVVVDGIPFGTYLLRVTLRNDVGSLTGFFEQEVEIGPGVTSSVTATLGPAPNPSPSPSASLGALFVVNPAPSPTPGLGFPAGSHDVAVMGDGRFAVAWGGSDASGVDQTFVRTYAANGSTLAPLQALTSNEPNVATRDVAAAVDDNARLLVATAALTLAAAALPGAEQLGNPSLEFRFLDLPTGDSLSLPQAIVGPGGDSFNQISAALAPANNGSSLGSATYVQLGGKGSEPFLARVPMPPATGTPAPLPSPIALGTNPEAQVAENSSGDLAVGTSLTSTDTEIKAGVFTNDLGQSQVEVTDTTTDLAVQTSVAVRGGRMVVVYAKTVTTGFGERRHVFASRLSFTPGSPSGTLTLLDATPIPVSNQSSNTGGENTPRVAMDSAGNFIVTWLHSELTEQTSIQARRFSAAGAGGAPFRLDDATNLYFRPRVGMDSSGNAVVVWSTTSGLLQGRQVPAAFGAP